MQWSMALGKKEGSILAVSSRAVFTKLTRGAVQLSLGNTAPYFLTTSRIASFSLGSRYTGVSVDPEASEVDAGAEEGLAG